MAETASEVTFKASPNVARMQPSSTLAAMQAALALKATGADVVDLGPGEPDFDTPAHIKEAAAAAMRAGQTKYTPTAGTRKLQQAIAGYYEREFGARLEASEVMATAGGKQAIFNAVVTLCGPGDEVLIPKPYWVTFPEIVTFAGATPVFIDTEETEFHLTAEQVARAVTPRTKLIILNSPTNPSGRVYPQEEFKRILELLCERGVSSLAPAAWTKQMLKVQGHSTSNPSSISQAAAVAAFNSGQECVGEML